MPRVSKQKARKDYPKQGIKKGETYYKWKFIYQPAKRSLTYPSRSQLTNSDFLSRLYCLEDQGFDGISSRADLTERVEYLIGEYEELLGEAEESLDAMPEHLQESSPVGEMLSERIDALNDLIDELSTIDLDYDAEHDGDEYEWLISIQEEASAISSGL